MVFGPNGLVRYPGMTRYVYGIGKAGLAAFILSYIVEYAYLDSFGDLSLKLLFLRFALLEEGGLPSTFRGLPLSIILFFGLVMPSSTPANSSDIELSSMFYTETPGCR